MKHQVDGLHCTCRALGGDCTERHLQDPLCSPPMPDGLFVVGDLVEDQQDGRKGKIAAAMEDVHCGKLTALYDVLYEDGMTRSGCSGALLRPRRPEACSKCTKMLRFGREVRVTLTRCHTALMRVAGHDSADLSVLSSAIAVCKHFEEMPRLWAGHCCRCKWQRHSIAQMKTELISDACFGKVADVTTDMQAKHLASKHSQPQGFDFGLKGMSNQGFEFAFGCLDGKGRRCVETEYIDLVYQQQSSQSLEEAMSTLKLALNIFHDQRTTFDTFRLISDKCNNFATMDAMPHILHGNSTGWDLNADPNKAIDHIFGTPPGTAETTSAAAEPASVAPSTSNPPAAAPTVISKKATRPPGKPTREVSDSESDEDRPLAQIVQAEKELAAPSLHSASSVVGNRVAKDFGKRNGGVFVGR